MKNNWQKIMANLSIDNILDILYDLEQEDRINIITYVKLKPRVFNVLSKQLQDEYIRNNIYINYNIGTMHNFIMQTEDKEQQKYVYKNLLPLSIEKGNLTFIYHTPDILYEIIKQDNSVLNMFNHTDYINNSFLGINRKKRCKVFIDNVYNFFDFILYLENNKENNLLVYQAINRKLSESGERNVNKKEVKELCEKIFNRIYECMLSYTDITINQYQQVYNFFNYVMNTEQERECLKKFLDFNVPLNNHKIKYSNRNKDLYDNIVFTSQLIK